MKRRLVRICVFLVLGAIANFVMAAAFAASVRVFDPDNFARLDEEQVVTDGVAVYWTVYYWDAPGSMMVVSDVGSEPVSTDQASFKPHDSIPNWVPVNLLSAPQGLGEDSHRWFEARGWPCVGLWCELDRELMGETMTSRNGITLPLTPHQLLLFRVPRVLPLRPIWPGFAINAVFYAGVLWMLFAAPFALRRRLREGGRRRRGLCVKCGYDLRGGRGAGSTGGPDAVVTCPECGATR